MGEENPQRSIYQNIIVSFVYFLRAPVKIHQFHFQQTVFMNSQETNQPEKKNDEQKKQQPEKEQKSGKLPVGKMLRQVREKKGLTIGDISLETNISSSNLVSIELLKSAICSMQPAEQKTGSTRMSCLPGDLPNLRIFLPQLGEPPCFCLL